MSQTLAAIPEIILNMSSIAQPTAIHTNDLPDRAEAPSPRSGTATPGTLAERVAALQASSPGPQSPTHRSSFTHGARTASPASGAVLDNGTNIGSTAGRKPSISNPAQLFNMERRTSTGGSRRMSRRGSGAITTPSGNQAVFHSRTEVSKSV